MVTTSTGSVLDGDEPGQDRLVTLSGRRMPLTLGRKARKLEEGACAKIFRIGRQFTLDDHATLALWAGDTGHGYDRLIVERGLLEDGSWASYALVYVPKQAWSTWGLTRRGDLLEVWRCSTGETVGRHAGMPNALASLPQAADHRRALPAMTMDEPGCAAPANAGRAETRDRVAAKA